LSLRFLVESYVSIGHHLIDHSACITAIVRFGRLAFDCESEKTTDSPAVVRLTCANLTLFQVSQADAPS